ncbi:ACT domain-containing protein, partial [Klebsiella pneumoniae]|uniref:ACT domain-containing protein n=1 Tax=Klebsiella pneumoniae TaxID=573 RepID=UPI003A862F3E
LRVQATDEPGTLGQIAALLAKENVSIEALIQKGVIDQSTAEIVILTHTTVECNVKRAIAAIEALSCVDAPITMIRMESLHD